MSEDQKPDIQKSGILGALGIKKPDEDKESAAPQSNGMFNTLNLK